jgi:hypothetical protein
MRLGAFSTNPKWPPTEAAYPTKYHRIAAQALVMAVAMMSAMARSFTHSHQDKGANPVDTTSLHPTIGL